MKIVFGCSMAAIMLSSCDSYNAENKSQAKLTGPVSHISKLKREKSDLISIASVGDGEISVGVLRYYLAQKGFGSRDKKIDKESLKALLDEIVSLELYKQAAIKNNLDKDPATVLSIARVLSSKYQTDVLAKNSSAVKVSSEEVELRYAESRQQYTTPARRRGAIISARTGYKGKSSENKKSLSILNAAAKDVASLNKENKFFGDLASSYSDDVVSKARRGDIGWIVEGGSINRYEPVVTETLFSLKNVGDVSPVVKGERGYYLVKLVDLVPAKQQSLKQVERKIHHQILQQKRHMAELLITDDLKEQFKVTINDSIMNDFITRVNTRNIVTDNMPPSFPLAVETK